MKFVLQRSSSLVMLLQALKTCNIKAKGEVESEFLFRITDGELTVTSLNEVAEQTVQLSADITEGQDGDQFSVSGQAIVDLLKQFPDEEINCTYSADRSIFGMGGTVHKSKFLFPTTTPDDFVLLNFAQSGARVNVSGIDLSKALKLTSFCTSTDAALAPLTAVRVLMEGTKLLAEASDQNRVSSVLIDTEDVGLDPLEFLLPRGSAETLSAILNGIDTVTIVPSDHLLRFEWDGTTFTTSLENGVGRKFPKLSKYIDGEQLASGKISRAELLRALKMASLIAKDTSVGVKISDDGLVITANEASRGASQETVVLQENDGESETTMSCTYFIKAVDSTTDPWINVVFRKTPSVDSIAIAVVESNYRHTLFPVAPQTPDGSA